jgi:hypothetical protein
MAARSNARLTGLRRTGALCVAAVACALLLSALAVRPAAAAQTPTERTMRIAVSTPGRVISGDTVTMRCRAKDQKGKAIKGVGVTFKWYLPEGTRAQKRTTNADGLASAGRVTDCGSAGAFEVKVVVTARWHGQVKKVTRTFTIIGGT